MPRQQRIRGRRSGRPRGSGRTRTRTSSTKSFATRCRLRRILRPSSTIAGTAAKSPRTSTTSATLFAICAPCPGDRQPCRLERRNVVDAVADHRDVAALVAERLDDAALLLGRDRPITLVSRRRRELGAISGSSRPSTGCPTGMPTSAATAATVAGRSPERIFSSTPWRWKKSTVARALGPQPLADDGETERRGRLRSRGRRRGRLGVPSATTRRPDAASRPAARRAARARRARAPPRRSVPVSDAPRSSRGGTRTARSPTPARRGAGNRLRVASTVALRVGGAGAYPPTRASSRPRDPPGRERGGGPELRRGERSGLVEADDVDRGE